MIRAETSLFPLGWISSSKNTPGERCSWLTTTLSAPLTMKVPLSVIKGNSPRNTSCSMMSFTVLAFPWLSLTTSLKVALSGAA